MTGNDPFANALAGVDNAESVGHLSYTVEPASNIIGSVLEVLYDRGYVDGFEYVDDGKAGVPLVVKHLVYDITDGVGR